MLSSLEYYKYLKRFEKGEIKKLGNYIKLFENDLIRLDYNRTFNDESEFIDWFKENCHLLGCELLYETKRSFPDAIIQKDDVIIRTEFEICSSNFIAHKHDPDKVDLVICICNDKRLQVDTLELPFLYNLGSTTSTIGDKASNTIYQNKITNVVQSAIRFKAEEIKKALFNNNQETIVKKATKIGSSIYLNVTGIIENNTFYKVIKEEDKIVLIKIDVEDLLRN